MSKPMKRSGFTQPIHKASANQLEDLGTLRITRDGRKFRYARAGASALAAGKIGIAATLGAGIIDEACASAHAIGDQMISETITAGVAYAENFFQSGQLQINDATGEGHQYLIDSSTAVTAAGTSIVLGLAEPIRVALTATTTQFSLIASPWQGVTESATEENVPVGVAPIVVPATYYYWAQTGGLACVLCDGTPAIGTQAVLGSVAGSVKAVPTPLDIDLVFPVGIFVATAGVDTEYKPVYLTID